jgi:hypothetical protein
MCLYRGWPHPLGRPYVSLVEVGKKQPTISFVTPGGCIASRPGDGEYGQNAQTRRELGTCRAEARGPTFCSPSNDRPAHTPMVSLVITGRRLDDLPVNFRVSATSSTGNAAVLVFKPAVTSQRAIAALWAAFPCGSIGFDRASEALTYCHICDFSSVREPDSRFARTVQGGLRVRTGEFATVAHGSLPWLTVRGLTHEFATVGCLSTCREASHGAAATAQASLSVQTASPYF